MSTRSYIGKQEGDTVRFIHCHWDGYPSYNGKILLNHYQDENKVNQLLELGNLSHLGKEIGNKKTMIAPKTLEDWDVLAQEEEDRKNQCISYSRDNDEPIENVGAKTITFKYIIERVTRKNDSWDEWGGEWFYLWKNGKWFVSKIASYYNFIFVPLSKANTQ